MAMLLKIHPETPSHREIVRVAQVLRKGGIVIFPTDTIYGMGCSIKHIKTVDKISKIRIGGMKKKTRYSIIVNSLSMLSEFTKPIDNQIFRLLKKNLPGPFTFILEANNNVPKLFHSNKRQIGIRMPDNNIIMAIVEELGHPVLTTSIKDEDDIVEYTTDPELIFEKYNNEVDIVINGGYGDNTASTIVDFTSGEPEIVRQGKGIFAD
jgi:tRNA threonylcarbamoyl adenosine modification protein (Sua5/YciO/YrdC/YwlC family)